MNICKECLKPHNRFVKGVCYPCYRREYRKNHLNLLRRQDRDWKREKRKNKSFREYSKKITKKSYDKNKDKYNFRRREEYKKNPEKNIIQHREYYKKVKGTPEFIKKCAKKYKKYYKTKHARITTLLKTQKRDSILMGVEFNLSYQDVLDILERDKVCVYCKKSKQIGLDHIIPKCKGGKTVKSNLVMCCFRCNVKKGRHIYDTN